MKKTSRKPNWNDLLCRSTLETLKPPIRKQLPKATFWLKCDEIPKEVRDQLKELIDSKISLTLKKYRVSICEVAFAVLHFLHPQSNSVRIVNRIKDINDTLRSEPPAHLVNNFKNLRKLRRIIVALEVKWGFRYP